MRFLAGRLDMNLVGVADVIEEGVHASVGIARLLLYVDLSADDVGEPGHSQRGRGCARAGQ